MGAAYLGTVIIDPDIADKIRAKHHVTPEEVWEACGGRVQSEWHLHPVYGRRLLVIGETYGGRRLKMILRAVDETDGTWRLATALVSG